MPPRSVRLLMLAALLGLGPAVANLAADPLNGDFEAGIQHWQGTRKDPVQPNADVVQDLDMLAWEKQDTAGDSKGALRVTLKDMADFRQNSHATGARMLLSPAIREGTTVKVSFDARLLEGEPTLKLMRSGGGCTGPATVELTSDWQRHEVTLTVHHVSPFLIFNLVEGAPQDDIQRVADGVFLLDNVTVEPVDDDTADAKPGQSESASAAPGIGPFRVWSFEFRVGARGPEPRAE